MAALTDKAPYGMVAATFLALALVSATAQNKNFTFQGTIVTVDDPFSLLDGSITNGAPFEGFYIFDSAATNFNADPTVAFYRSTRSRHGVTVLAGNYVFRTNPRKVNFLISVVNRPGMDNYQFISYHNVCSQPVKIGIISWQLDDPTGTAVSDVSLPLTPPTLAAWESLSGLTIVGGCHNFLIRGMVHSISEAPAVIPERPASSLDEAVELRWPTRLGCFYQVQLSEDMQTWTDLGEPVLGDGTEVSRFFPRRPGSTYYRAEPVDFVSVAPGSAGAEVKHFAFQGTIDGVSDRDFVLDGSLTNGAAFEGSYTFDPTATDTADDPTVGRYLFSQSRFGLTVKAGNYVFRTNPRQVNFVIELVNRPGMDNYLVASDNNLCSQPVTIGRMSWQLDDPTGQALTNVSLPLTPPTLAAWESVSGLTIASPCYDLIISGRVNSISEAPAITLERPEATLHEAVEVRWPSRVGYFYQVQVSEDMQTWTNVGEPVLGDGTELSGFYPRQSENSYYRAEIANFKRR